MSVDFNSVSRSFVDFYYQTFDSNRAQLAGLYKEHSMLSFEGNQIQGVAKIVEKLQSLPFTKIQHKVITVDAQPSHPQMGSIIVSVTGQLITDNEGNPLSFCQIFHLVPENNSFWVLNDIFRLNYG
ncbi:hypothetical protein BKA69DRAFT_1108923 [Paraphysoderma sedebokerense]|nr:hypothetical protein BKA69DRAFT_1108923 [Paraphysoderma sedebokerense]